MKILAFETSCDDTSIAIFENEKLVCMHTKSQIKIHNETGGVVPEVASREHANVIFDVLDDVLKEWKVTLQDIDYIAVTTHPGLVPSLLTGITVASTLSETLKIPILPIDHIQAHIFSNFLEREESEIEFPLVCLTVSGGHNEIYYMPDMWSREKLGQTQDDAAGEAFDKVAKMMGLGYPGGPIVSKLAAEYTWNSTQLFPRVFLEKSEFGFSFSGLKSAVKREVDKRHSLRSSTTSLYEGGSQKKVPPSRGGCHESDRGSLTLEDQQEISFEFQAAVNEVLCYKLIHAAEEKRVRTIMLAGWVSANNDLNVRISQAAQKLWLTFFAPIKKLYCMDNAAMIGILAYYRIKYKQFEEKIWTVELGRW
mgnify:CR=1 FL=1